MPKLIVYVKADTWRRVQEKAGGDAAPLARAISAEAIEDFVNGLSEGEPREAKVVASEPTPATGRDDITAEYDLSPVRPGKCLFSTAAGTKCKVCGKVHPL